jgi:hypothetical protein
MKVFLGGTVNGSTWRQALIPMLDVDYFDPVVDDWDEEAHRRELHEREHCDFCLYVITPLMEGYYSLAEVADDSFRKADKTIFCCLPEDGGRRFTERQLLELRRVGKLVQANGAVWKDSLREVADFLNSAKGLASDSLLQQAGERYDVFISYGRRHSLAFAHRLYQSLAKRGLRVWFDMNDIPLGVDFQAQIDDGIRRSDNILFLLSPHSIHSEYCAKELELALKYRKRLVPILHVEPQEERTWAQIHPEVGRRNWVYCRQAHEAALSLSAKAYALKGKVADLDPSEWQLLDSFDGAFGQLCALLDSHRAYVRSHTALLDKALDWERGSRPTSLLLAGDERQEAEQWLLRSRQSFQNHTGHLIQPPCAPTDLVARFIMESRKNGQNMQCDVFICHDSNDRAKVDAVVHALHRHGFSTWLHDYDIAKGSDYGEAIMAGVEQSSAMLLFVSEGALASGYCQKEYAHARACGKRIVPVQLDRTAPDGRFPGLAQLQYVNFGHLGREAAPPAPPEADKRRKAQADVEARHSKTPFELAMDELVQALEQDRGYYEQHRVFLVQALRWERQGKQHSHLLRGFNLENAQTWLRINGDRPLHPPTDSQKAFILASDAAKGQLGTEVFISYSRKDGDFARKLNTQLQLNGHTTWFDQESISKGVDFEKEIFKGIDGCDNFVFVVSPDSVASAYCEREVDYAVGQGKRIITLLWRETAPAAIPAALRAINWVDFAGQAFAEAYAELVREIETDRQHAHGHTVWQQRALEWEQAGRSADYLLNASALGNAQAWLEASRGKRPAPTGLQQAYLQASEAAIAAAEAEAEAIQRSLQKRLQNARVAIGVALMLLVVAGFAFLRSEQNAKEAEMQALRADSNADAAVESAEQANKALRNYYQERFSSSLTRSGTLHRLGKAALARKNLATAFAYGDSLRATNGQVPRQLQQEAEALQHEMEKGKPHTP